MKKQPKSNKRSQDDYDSPWKEILENYYPEFIEFFFPKAYKDIDWVMEIPKELSPIFEKKLERYEKEKKMYYITQLQRPSFERGQKEGEKRGEKKGEKKGLIKMLSTIIAKKFNSQVRRESPRLRNLEKEDLMSLAENIFAFNSLESVHDWINQKKKTQKNDK